ncbi:hypothetical protein C2G38_1390925 [Gigaspora rosea]|uniref:Uncharacterized protein n=1 Tax=Gigaspora rosea TaxID=44941 RepID=A0A397V626_9GLOM|nr:hypothetical protein C2G38_1390925 [Gigaspora rosea]
MAMSKTLFNINEIDEKKFNIQMYKDDHDIQYISYVVENKLYRCTLNDPKNIPLNEKFRNTNPYPIFRALIQSTFQSVADHFRKNRFKNQDVSTLTGKMWHSSENFQKEFIKYAERVNLYRPKPLVGFKSYDPHQKSTKEKRSNKTYKKSGIDHSIVPYAISIQPVQPTAESSTESLSDFIHNGSQWQDDKNNMVNHLKQSNHHAKLPVKENLANGAMDPTQSLNFLDFEYLNNDFYNFINSLSNTSNTSNKDFDNYTQFQ